MRAIVYEKYGNPDVLTLREVEKPIPKENEVLVKIHAASVNSWDWDRLTGKPYLYRLISGIFKPQLNILGADIAGTVESVGEKVSSFEPGDEVYGDVSEGNWGGFAEYACAYEKTLILKPKCMTWEDAAAIPQAGVMALQSLRDIRQILPGQKLLMNGAGGGIGSFIIQLAKMYGAEVTGVDSAIKLDKMRSWGADHVIDYAKQDFTKNGIKYDLIVDVVANRSVFDYQRALTETGNYLMIGGSIPSLLQIALLGPILSRKAGKKLGILMHKPNKDLAYINELFENGKLKSIIEKIYPLQETPEALQHLGDGNVLGKLVIKM